MSIANAGEECQANMFLSGVRPNPRWHGLGLKLYDKVLLPCLSELHYREPEKRSTSVHGNAIGSEDHRRF
jgi:hypothetical protein